MKTIEGVGAERITLPVAGTGLEEKAALWENVRDSKEEGALWENIRDPKEERREKRPGRLCKERD